LLFRASATGDMTLSLLDDTGFKVLGIDMLAQNTMRAGTNGALLVRALNDLTLISDCSSTGGNSIDLTDVEGSEISPRPWRCESSWKQKKLSIHDGLGSQIATRIFPKHLSEERFGDIVNALDCALNKINHLESQRCVQMNCGNSTLETSK
jgi:hypothetical protein